MATKKKATPVEKDIDDEERPAKKKKKKQSAGNPAVFYIIVGTVVALLVVAGGGTAAFFIFRRPANPQVAQAPPDGDKKGAEEKDTRTPAQIVSPSIKEGNPANKGGIANNVRGSVYRTERRNELAHINKMHAGWSLDPGPKTLDGFLEYIKRDFKVGYDTIKEGYYKVNVRAKSGTSDIVAGENREDTGGVYLIVRANGNVEPVPAAEFKQALP